MPFIHVGRSDLDAKSLQGSNTADSEQNFLLDAHFFVAAIERRGDGAVFRLVFRNIRIE